MATRTPSAGAKLKADMAAMLDHASKDAGRRLEFDEREVRAIAAAAAAADRAETLAGLWSAELVRQPESRPRTLVALSAEMRLCEAASVGLLKGLQIGVPAKSPRHQAAARARWNRQPPRDFPRDA